jgi:hypothetical protein
MPCSSTTRSAGCRKVNPGDLKFFRKWLDHDEGSHLLPQGREAWTWDPSDTEDIFSVSGMSTNEDILAHWISDQFVPWYHRKLGHRMNVRHLQGRAIWLSASLESPVVTVHRSLRATQKAIVSGSTAIPPLPLQSARSALSSLRSYLSFRYSSFMSSGIL